MAKGLREAILWKFGPYRFSPGNTDDRGHRRRIELAIRSVEYVLPFWRESWPTDDTPSRILQEVRAVIKGEVDRETADKDFNRYWEYAEELTNETNNIAGVVGLAAANALSLAITDGFADGHEIDLEKLDNDQFTSNDVHFFAAAVFAGGPVYGISIAPHSDNEKRQQFWIWWLTEAVPAAFESVQ